MIGAEPMAFVGDSTPLGSAESAERIWTPGAIARQVSAETPAVDLPQASFISSPDYGGANDTSVGVPRTPMTDAWRSRPEPRRE